MATKPKRNKQHRPRLADPSGGLVAIAIKWGAAEDRRPILDVEQTKLGISYWLAFERMIMGQSSEEDWSVIACSINIALMLSEQGIGNEYEPYLIKALDGIFIAKLRAEKHGVWRFDGEAIGAIREAFEIHDEQIKIATKEEMRNALSEVHKRIKNNHVYQQAA